MVFTVGLLAVIAPSPICVHESDCSIDKACIEGDCRNPCTWYKPCAQNAKCRVDTHRAVCACLPGFEGTPLVSCLPGSHLYLVF